MMRLALLAVLSPALGDLIPFRTFEVVIPLIREELQDRYFSHSIAKFSPDENKVLISTSFQTAQIWDADSGTYLQSFDHQTLIGEKHGLTSVAFIPGGGVVTTSTDGKGWVWDLDQKLVCTMTTKFGHGLHFLGLRSVVASPDGMLLLTGSLDRTARLWNPRNCSELHVFKVKGLVYDAVFSGDGLQIATGKSRGAQLHDVATRLPLKGFNHRNFGNQRVSSVAVNCMGCAMLGSQWSEDGRVTMWDAGTGEVLRIFGESPIQDNENKTNLAPCFVRLSPDGTVILIGAKSSVTIWDAMTGKRLCYIREDGPQTLGVDFNHAGDRILVVSLAGFVELYDVTSCLANRADESHESETQGGAPETEQDSAASDFIAIAAVSAFFFFICCSVCAIQVKRKQRKMDQNVPAIASRSPPSIVGNPTKDMEEDTDAEVPQIYCLEGCSALMNVNSGELSSCTPDWNVTFQRNMDGLNFYKVITSKFKREVVLQSASGLTTVTMVPDIMLGPLANGNMVQFDLQMSPGRDAPTKSFDDLVVSLTLHAKTAHLKKDRSSKKQRLENGTLAGVAEDDADASCSSSGSASRSSSSSLPSSSSADWRRKKKKQNFQDFMTSYPGLTESYPQLPQLEPAVISL